MLPMFEALPVMPSLVMWRLWPLEGRREVHRLVVHAIAQPFLVE